MSLYGTYRSPADTTYYQVLARASGLTDASAAIGASNYYIDRLPRVYDPVAELTKVERHDGIGIHAVIDASAAGGSTVFPQVGDKFEIAFKLEQSTDASTWTEVTITDFYCEDLIDGFDAATNTIKVEGEIRAGNAGAGSILYLATNIDAGRLNRYVRLAAIDQEFNGTSADAISVDILGSLERQHAVSKAVVTEL